MICSKKYGKCSFCSYDKSNSTAMSDGRRRLVVTRRRSKAEKNRGKLEVTVVDSSIKVCSDCRTSYTPLWRNGPDGPMSLCNACGIRYRKRKSSDRLEEEGARKVVAVFGNAESKPCSNAEKTKKGLTVKEVKEEEEVRRRQRDKQENILMVMFRRRHEALNGKRRWYQARSAGDGEEIEEVAEAALLLLSLSSDISVHS